MNYHIDKETIFPEKDALYFNEPWLIDGSLQKQEDCGEDTGYAKDNIRIYVPLDLSQEAILRRLDDVIARYREATEENEFAFESDTDMLVHQIEIYDQIWLARRGSETGKHSREGLTLVRLFLKRLGEIPDHGAERFPFEMMELLEDEYLH